VIVEMVVVVELGFDGVLGFSRNFGRLIGGSRSLIINWECERLLNFLSRGFRCFSWRGGFDSGAFRGVRALPRWRSLWPSNANQVWQKKLQVLMFDYFGELRLVKRIREFRCASWLYISQQLETAVVF
jgi:hypothetical protein